MIKNDLQLASAIRSLELLERHLSEIRAEYSGLEAELLSSGLERQVKDITEEVHEYQLLKELSLTEAVEGPLSKPVLIERIGELLAKLRIAGGITQSELAEKLGWHQANVSRFESENYSSQTLGKLVEYVHALGVWLHVVPSLSSVATLAAQSSLESPVRSVKRYTEVRREIDDVDTTDADDVNYDMIYRVPASRSREPVASW